MALTRIKTDQILDGTITGNDIDAGTNITASDYRIGAAYPTIKPSLNLDFANTKSLDPRIDFTRASTATYYDGVTHAKAEENLLIRSQSEIAKTVIGGDITNSSETAPDGTATAFLVTENTGAPTGLRVSHDSNRRFTSGLTYTHSVFLKTGTNTYGFVSMRTSTADSVGAEFNLSTGTVHSTTQAGSFTNVNASIFDVGSGWYRCSVTGTAGESVNDGFFFSGISDGSGVDGNGYPEITTSGLTMYMWGFQAEIRDSVTAYTPTTDTPITNYIPVLKTASTNEPRFDHDPITGESLGLLIESQRTNLLTYSEDFSDSDWIKTSSSITANTIVAPDGTLTGDKLVSGDTGTPSFQGVTQPVSLLSAGNVFSVYAKTAEITQIELRAYGNSADDEIVIVDISTQTFLSGSGTIESLANGWYRVSINAPENTENVRISLAKNGNRTFTPDNYSGIYIWGAQLEES